MSSLAVAASLIAVWRREPWTFVRQVLQAEPDGWQLECLHALVSSGFKRFALKASKGPGKSTLLAWVIWWFLATRLHPKVVATSITEDNLKDCLWAELAKWQQRSDFLKSAFVWTAERIFARDHKETWWASARTWPKQADPQQQANTLAGVHADAVLFVLDESGGIPDAVMAAAEGGLANADKAAGREALIIQAGNPTHLVGPLYRACTRERALWWVKEISGDPDDPLRAPRVSIEWAREQIQKYGRDHPYVMVNVLGKFPPGQSNALIAVDDAVAASKRVVLPAQYIAEPKVLGVDVARFGDDETVIAPRQGPVCFGMKVFRNIDLMECAGQIAMVIERWKPDATFIDQTGIGAGVVDRLHQMKYPVIGVEFGGRPLEGKYLNRRAEMWWNMAEWVKRGCLPDDAQLIGELPAPTYKFAQDGRLQLESKDDMKKRALPSPNRADALALTFAAPVAHHGLRAMQDRSQGEVPRNSEYNPLRRI